MDCSAPVSSVHSCAGPAAVAQDAFCAFAGDSQRAIRNAASQFARLDEEKEQLLTACNHGP